MKFFINFYYFFYCHNNNTSMEDSHLNESVYVESKHCGWWQTRMDCLNNRAKTLSLYTSDLKYYFYLLSFFLKWASFRDYFCKLKRFASISQTGLYGMYVRNIEDNVFSCAWVFSFVYVFGFKNRNSCYAWVAQARTTIRHAG